MAFPAMIDATMVARARVLLNEPTALNFTDAEIQAWIDRAANYISKDARTSEMGGVSYIPLVTATTSYAYSAVTEPVATAKPLADATSEFNIEIDSLFYCAAVIGALGAQTATSGYALKKIHPRQLMHLNISTTTQGPPRYWCDRNENILIYPPPSAATENGKVVEVLWYKVQNTYEDSGTTYNLPNHMKEYVLWYVLAQANLKLKRYSASNMFMSLFTKFIMFHRADSYPKPVDSLADMVQPDYTQIA